MIAPPTKLFLQNKIMEEVPFPCPLFGNISESRKYEVSVSNNETRSYYNDYTRCNAVRTKDNESVAEQKMFVLLLYRSYIVMIT